MYLSKLSKKKQPSIRFCMIRISTFRVSSVEMEGGRQANCTMCIACLSLNDGHCIVFVKRNDATLSVVNFWRAVQLQELPMQNLRSLKRLEFGLCSVLLGSTNGGVRS